MFVAITNHIFFALLVLLCCWHYFCTAATANTRHGVLVCRRTGLPKSVLNSLQNPPHLFLLWNPSSKSSPLLSLLKNVLDPDDMFVAAEAAILRFVGSLNQWKSGRKQSLQAVHMLSEKGTALMDLLNWVMYPRFGISFSRSKCAAEMPSWVRATCFCGPLHVWIDEAGDAAENAHPRRRGEEELGPGKLGLELLHTDTHTHKHTHTYMCIYIYASIS